MDKKSTIIIAVIIILGVLGFLVISFQKSTLDTSQDEAQMASTTRWENTPAENPEVLITSKTTVTAKHAYQNGKHIIAGEVPMPTPCHILDSKAVASQDKKQVLVTLVSSVKTGETCAQVITPARFKLTVSALKDAKFTATLNGQEITLSLIEAGPNEDLDKFDLYIKG